MPAESRIREQHTCSISDRTVTATFGVGCKQIAASKSALLDGTKGDAHIYLTGTKSTQHKDWPNRTFMPTILLLVSALDVCRPLSLLSFSQALGHVKDGILERVIFQLEDFHALRAIVD